jgi:hypothetical protein
MLQYLSSKLYQEPKPHAREPRAALFLNRFTRSLTIMFATSSVSQILGLEPEQLIGKSFYYCIAENCLHDAVKCLESAKANDSIAYLRFWYRDPLQSVSRAQSLFMDDDEDTDEDDGGVRIREGSRSSVEMEDSATPQREGVTLPQANGTSSIPRANEVAVETPTPTPGVIGTVANQARTLRDRLANEPPVLRDRMVDLDRAIEERVVNRLQPRTRDRTAHSSSGHSTDMSSDAAEAIFDPPEFRRYSTNNTSPDRDAGIEVEAVISCTSDGLVVVLRRARPPVPHATGATDTTPYYANGVFASPWAATPVLSAQVPQSTTNPQLAFPATTQPAETGFMAAIRDVAVFAWSLTSINGSLAQYGVGQPTGEALPPGGLPIWDPHDLNGKVNDMYNGFAGSRHRPLESTSGSAVRTDDLSSSDDEVLWKRDTTMSAWRRPKRRAHGDAFGEDGVDGIDGQGTDGSRKKPSKDRPEV